MKVPEWMYWVTYLVLPILAALVVAASELRAGQGTTIGLRLRRARRASGLALIGAALVHVFELMQMGGELSGLGWLLVGGTFAARAALGVALAVAARATPTRVRRAVERGLGLVVLASSVAMVLVAAQVLWIFG